MTEEYPDHIRLHDLKARKGHLCQGGQFNSDGHAICGCGTWLDELPDFMTLSPEAQRNVARVRQAVARGDEDPPAPFHHANGEPCYGCQSCFANMDIDYDDVADHYDTTNTSEEMESGRWVDPMAEADALEEPGKAVQVQHDAPDMAPAVPVIDPSQPYGPAEVERAILDANRRLELGLKHEANLIAATEQAKIEYELAYARSVSASRAGAADQRKADAVVATERQLRAWIEAKGARDAMKSITHTLRSTVSALQSVSRSVGTSYTGPQGRGQ